MATRPPLRHAARDRVLPHPQALLLRTKEPHKLMTSAWHAVAAETISITQFLPLIVALEEDPEVDALVDRVLADGDVAAARELQRRLVCTEGLFETRKTMVEHSLAARRALRVLRPGPHRDALDRLAYSLAASGARIAEENE